MRMIRSKQQVFALAFAMAQLALVGWLDYISSYEISLGVFYYLPIAYAAWNLGWAWSFGFGLLCTLTLTWAEVAAGRHYSHEWIIGEVAVMRLLGFSFVAYSFNRFKRTIEDERAKVRRLEGLFTFCSSCHKLRDEQGNWTNLDSFLRDAIGTGTKAKLCPTCAREIYAKSGRPASGP